MMFSRSTTRMASNVMLRRSMMARRWLTEKSAAAKETVTKETVAPPAPKQKIVAIQEESAKKGMWNSAAVWGGAGALAGWGMSGAAIYDAFQQGPEVISMTMTPVLIVYSTLFARWAWVVQPQNLLLCGCHVTNIAAQVNQMRRALEYKTQNGQGEQVKDMMQKVGMGGAVTGLAIAAGPRMRSALTGANLGMVSTISAADAGPFTVHFWAPISKWFISGASFLDLYRPTDQISLPQYTALTLTGLFFTRYALLVTPINYTLCSVNIALFLSSGWHLGRKIKADYIDDKPPAAAAEEETRQE
jgi:hypothetical protein